jgi:hypothetical protein
VVKVPFLVTVAENNYMYGQGPLTMIVTAVHEKMQVGGVTWVVVSGLEVGWDGQRMLRPWVMVRASALRAVQPR